MKRFYFVLVPMILAMVSIIVDSPAHAQSIPTQITTCQELQNINNNLSGNYQLANDIDCSATTTWNNGFGFVPIDSYAGNASAPVFTGVLDGQGHTINNLYINASNVGIGTSGPVSVGTTSPLGVFSVASGAVIENVNVANATIKGGQYNIIAILAGYMQNNGVVHNVSVQGSVVAGKYAYTGGLVGSLESSQISESSADINITGGDYTVGGLVGYFYNGAINESYAVGSINSQAITGGLVGTSENQSSINNSYSNVGLNFTCLPQGSYNSGGIGGLVGNSYDSTFPYLTISDSYAAGKITTQGSNCANYETGGLVASASHIPTVTSSYWDSQATGQYTSVGSSSSAGLTTAQMEQQFNFVGWNFTNIWISDNQHYPIFIWQQEPHIKLWNTLSAASQGSTLEPPSPPQAVNWTNISNINNVGINWTDLLVLSKPFVWNYQSATSVGGFPNSINWTDLGAFSTSAINWGDVYILARLGINWASANPLVKSGINWADWFVATVSGVNWNDVYVASRVGINWTNLGTIGGEVNWSNLAGITRQGVNWGEVSVLTQENVNWNNTGILNALKLNSTDLHTLRTIGVNPNGAFPSLPLRAQLTINLTGSGAGKITSLPGGINCTSGSGNGCSASFTLFQPVTLNFSSSSNSAVTNWGGCTPISTTSCTVTPDQSLVLNIAVNPTVPVNVVLSGPGQATFVSSPSGINCSLFANTGGGTCYAWFPQNQPVTLTATTSPSGTPIDWGQSGCSSTATTCTITPSPGGQNWNIQVPPPVAFVLNVSGNGFGNLSVAAQPVNGYLGCTYSLNPSKPGTTGCAGSYSPGTQLTLTATPVAGSIFNEWTGIPGCLTQNPCTVTINSSINGAANFILQPPISQIDLNMTGTGLGTITSSRAIKPVSGLACSIYSSISYGDCSAIFNSNKPVELKFSSPNHSTVASWGVSGCTNGSPTCTVTPNGNTKINMLIAGPVRYTVTTGTYGAGSATILCNAAACPASVFGGTSIVFSAKPAKGTIFETWGNTCVDAGGTANGATCAVDNITSNVSITAILGLAPPTYTITTSTSGAGSGKILCNGGTCPKSVTAGTVINFTAQPNSGSILTGLGGVCAAPGGPIFTCPFDVTSNISVSAFFIKSPPPAPTALAATTSAAGIALSWKTSYGISFNVYRAETGVNGNKYTLIKYVGYPNTTYTDTTMPNNGRYLYYVTGVYYPNVESPKSNIVTVNWTS